MCSLSLAAGWSEKSGRSNPLSIYFGDLIWNVIVLAISKREAETKVTSSLTSTLGDTVESAGQTEEKQPRDLVRSVCWEIKPTPWSGWIFRNISLVYKFCNSLYLLIGLQRNTLYSKPNQRVTPFSQQRDLLFLLISDNLLGQKTRGQIITGELVRYYARKILLHMPPRPCAYPSKLPISPVCVESIWRGPWILRFWHFVPFKSLDHMSHSMRLL